MGIGMMKSLFLKIPQYFYGKVRYQNVFQNILLFALRGLNYNNTIRLESTGEKKVVDLFLNTIKKEDELVIIDAGAHHGEFIDLFPNDLIRKRKLLFHLFEPQHSCINILKKKYANSPNIIINHLALGKEKQEGINLYTCPQTLVAFAFEFNVPDYLPRIKMNGVEKVNMINLYNYCKENNIDFIDFLKIDVEGLEYECLYSIYSFIQSKNIHFIQFEYSSINLIKGNHFHDFWDLLSPFYNIYRIVIDGIVPISKYNSTLEMPLPINYLAIKK